MKCVCARAFRSALLAALLSAGSLLAADWPQWLGPNQDNVAPANNFVAELYKWDVLWQTNVGLGYSAVTVANGKAYTLGHNGKSQETLYCFDAATGRPVWKYSYDAQLLPKMHPGGPNATPTVFEGKIYTVSKDGQALCLSADKGEKIWDVNLLVAMRTTLPQWGFASSPVIFRNNVLFSAGKVAALNRLTGKLAWVSTNDYKPGYSTPMPFARDDKEFIAALDGEGLSVLSPDGTEIARRPFKANYDMNANTPMPSENGRRILVSGNLNTTAFGFDGKGLSENWSTNALKSGMGSTVQAPSGVMFGIDGSQEKSTDRFVCMNWTDAEVRWVKENFGYGTVIGVGTNWLLSLTENGELVTMWAAKGDYSEIARKQILGRRCWTTPVYANDRIYVRNEKGDVVCLGVK